MLKPLWFPDLIFNVLLVVLCNFSCFSMTKVPFSFSTLYYIVASEKGGESGPWMKSERCKKFEGEKKRSRGQRGEERPEK
jgi:hypothetical protein